MVSFESYSGIKIKGLVDGRKVEVKVKGDDKSQISGLDDCMANGFICPRRSTGRESEL